MTWSVWEDADSGWREYVNAAWPADYQTPFAGKSLFADAARTEACLHCRLAGSRKRNKPSASGPPLPPEG